MEVASLTDWTQWRSNRLAQLLAVGLALRLAAFLAFRHAPLDSDPRAYLELAQELISHRQLLVAVPIYGTVQGIYAPGYPLLLASFGLVFGVGLASAALVNALIDAATAWLLYRIDWRAAALFFCWPTVVLNSIVPQKESFTCLLCLSLLLVGQQRGRAVLIGILAAALILTQPALLGFPAAVMLVFRRSIRSIGIAALICMFAMVPWWIRNSLLFHAFVPLTTGAGASFYYVVFGDFPRFDGPEIARFNLAGKLALQHAIAHPLAYLWAVAKQFGTAMFRDSFALERVWQGAPLWLVRLFEAAWIALLAIATTSLKYWRLALICGLTLLPMIWLEFGERHRYFMLPVVALMTAQAFDRWRRYVRESPSP